MRTFPAKDTTKLLFESTMDFAAAGTTSQVLPPIKPAAAAPAHDEIRHSNEPVENEYYYGGENGYYGDDGDDYEGDETNARMYSVQDKQLLPYFPSSSDDNNQYKEQEAKANHIRRKNANNAPPPNVTATANIHLPPSFGKSTSQTASEISAAVAAATATANAAAAKTSGNTLKYFLDRLTLNERTQRDLMMETGRLHNEMGLSMHHQEGVAASMESMRLAIYNIQNLLYSVTAQMQVQKDGIVLLMENERVRDQQQQAMWSQMNQAIDEARQERQELRQDIQQLRTEVQTLRTDVARQQSETDSKFKNSSTTIELVYKQVTEQSSVALNDVRSYIKMLESKFGGSLNAADSNLMRVSKVLHDFSLGNKREEEVGREKLRADFIKTLETSFVKLVNFGWSFCVLKKRKQIG